MLQKAGCAVPARTSWTVAQFVRDKIRDAVANRIGTAAGLAVQLLAAIRGGVNSLMAEILEDHVRLHIVHPNRRVESPEELTEDLISLVRAYLK